MTLVSSTDRQIAIREALDQIPDLEYAQPKSKHWIDYSLLILFSFFFRILPRPVNYFITHRLADLVSLFLKKRNNMVLDNMMEVLQLEDHSKAKKILKRSYYQFVENWVNLVNHERLSPPELENLFDTDEMAQLREVEKTGRGVIIAACHMGPWELVPRILHLKNYPTAIISAVQHNPLCDKFFNDLRAQKGFHKMVHNRLGIRHVLNLLKKGGRLVVIADVDVGGDKGIFVPFMGKVASTPRGPAELALRTGALIYTGVIMKRDNGKYYVSIGNCIDPLEVKGAREEAVRAITTQVNDSISNIIREYPEQWFWLQRRWKSKPPQ